MAETASGRQQESNAHFKTERKEGGRKSGRGGSARRAAPPKKVTDGNQVWVSTHQRPSFYGNIALRMFAKHDTVELHGLGEAISSAVEVAEYLIHLDKSTLQRITTSTVRSGSTNKPEVVVILKRTQGGLETALALEAQDARDKADPVQAHKAAGYENAEKETGAAAEEEDQAAEEEAEEDGGDE